MSPNYEPLSSSHYLVKHAVGPTQNGIRLDIFLKDRYRRRSREELKRVIDSGSVSVCRMGGPHLLVGRTKPSSQLLVGDEVLIQVEKKPEPSVNFEYQILFEDESLFVINKPANLPVHPAGRYYFNTLLTHLKTQGHKTPLNADQHYFLAHRIDKETSGVLVLTKTKEVCAQITRQFAERSIQKRYLAIVHGVCQDSFSVDNPLKRATESQIQLKMRSASESEGGMVAWTDFKRLKTFEVDNKLFSLIECFPRTGRQHQIRVHLEIVGHPIVGDKLYGLPESEALRFFNRENLSAEAVAKLLLPTHALHASWIRFKHPLTERVMEFNASFPIAFSQFCQYDATNTL